MLAATGSSATKAGGRIWEKREMEVTIGGGGRGEGKWGRWEEEEGMRECKASLWNRTLFHVRTVPQSLQLLLRLNSPEHFTSILFLLHVHCFMGLKQDMKRSKFWLVQGWLQQSPSIKGCLVNAGHWAPYPDLCVESPQCPFELGCSCSFFGDEEMEAQRG